MAATGYTPILIYASGTTGNTPLAANMTSSASGAELAINFFDGKLFYKDSGGTVQVLATKASAITPITNNGVVYINSSGQATSGTGLVFDGTKLTATGAIQAGANSGFALGANTFWYGGETGAMYFGTNASYPIQLYTAGSLRATLDSAGNLGLGVTPSAWGSGSYKGFQIGGSTSIMGRASGSDAYFMSNTYFDQTNYRYVASLAAAQYAQSGGAHYWYTAPSGTAGNAITFTQAMTLDASGRLGINQTSPSYYLDITGPGTSNGSTLRLNDSASSANSKHLLLSRGAATASVGIAGALANDPLWISRSGGYDLLLDSSGGFSSTTTAANYAYKATNSHASDPYGVQIIYSAANPNGTGNSFLYCNDSALRAQIRSNGGLANYSANDVNLSDRREKTNFAPAGDYLSKICAIPVQTFNYIDQAEDDPGLTLGVVAQDVQAVAPELVMESNWGTEDNPKMRLSIYQTDLQYALMKSIQELKAELDAAKARIAALETK